MEGSSVVDTAFFADPLHPFRRTLAELFVEEQKGNVSSTSNSCRRVVSKAATWRAEGILKSSSRSDADRCSERRRPRLRPLSCSRKDRQRVLPTLHDCLGRRSERAAQDDIGLTLSIREDDFRMKRRASDPGGDGDQVGLALEDFDLAGAGEFGEADGGDRCGCGRRWARRR